MIEARPNSQAAFETAINVLNDPTIPKAEMLLLPPEPDQEKYPDLHAFWTEILSGSSIEIGVLASTPPPPPPPPDEFPSVSPPSIPSPRRIAPRPSRQQSSGNWSGAALTARDGRMFTDVTATWVIPSVKVPASATAVNPAAASRDTYECSCWVGLDGQRSYSNSTLPQVGTEQSFNKGGNQVGQAALVWFQWWPLDEMVITNLPVAPEDRVYCWLTAVSPTQVRCIVKAVSKPGTAEETSRIVRFFVEAPEVRYTSPNIPRYKPLIWGATAEWITEAPAVSVAGGPHNVPDFVQVEFQHCYAITRREPLDEDQHVQDLTSPTLIHMHKIEKFRKVPISRAERPTDVPALNVVRTGFVG